MFLCWTQKTRTRKTCRPTAICGLQLFRQRSLLPDETLITTCETPQGQNCNNRTLTLQMRWRFRARTQCPLPRRLLLWPCSCASPWDGSCPSGCTRTYGCRCGFPAAASTSLRRKCCCLESILFPALSKYFFSSTILFPALSKADSQQAAYHWWWYTSCYLLVNGKKHVSRYTFWQTMKANIFWPKSFNNPHTALNSNSFELLPRSVFVLVLVTRGLQRTITVKPRVLLYWRQETRVIPVEK